MVVRLHVNRSRNSSERISLGVYTTRIGHIEKHSEMLRNAGNKVRAQRSANAEFNNRPMMIAPSRTRIMFRCGMLVLRTLGWPLLMTVLIITPACAQQSFDEVAGLWSGVGSMKPSDGPRERVRCKVDYIVKNGGQSVKMNVRCASDAYKMELTANIDQKGTALSGNWFESQYRQGGKISGQNVNGLIEAKIEGDTITALLTVRTKGNRQSFAMESPGAWVSQVSIDLVRDPR